MIKRTAKLLKSKYSLDGLNVLASCLEFLVYEELLTWRYTIECGESDTMGDRLGYTEKRPIL